jgi:alpha-2-macroglobulin
MVDSPRRSRRAMMMPMNPRLLAVLLALLSTAGVVYGQEEDSGRPLVRNFSPQGTVKQVRQVRVHFSRPMVPFGDPGEPVEPFEIDCPASGSGKWMDPQNWVYDFDEELSSGLRCRFVLRSDVRTLDGVDLSGRRSFEFDTGGPAILRSSPFAASESVDEAQIFILQTDGPVSEESVPEHVYFVVDGIASAVGVDVVRGEERRAILDTEYYFRQLPEDRVLLLRARQIFPNEARIRLVWGRGTASATGVPAGREQILDFRVRPRFEAQFSCQRVNPDRECVPLTDMWVGFSAPVPVERLRGVRLRGPEDRVWEGDPGREEHTGQVTFKGPFPPETELLVELPAGIVDDAGRELANAGRYPLRVRTDDYPPLAKFAAPFGIIESTDPVLPVTVRNLEPELRLHSLTVEGPPVMLGSRLRVPGDEAIQVFNWLKRVSQQSWDDRERSLFAATVVRPERFSFPRPAGEKAFEVIGIPLARPGFYVVEIESEILGAALLEEPKPMYVSTAALVTDLGVHFKWGAESSLVWVTRLSSAEPVAGAEVEIRDCTGAPLWQGRTNRDGIAFAADLPNPDEALQCSWGRLEGGLFVVARAGDDMSFVHSDWSEGIEPWRFRLPTEYDFSLVNAHTIFDRTLFRAGETVYMKHVLRRRTTGGFGSVRPDERPDTLVITHQGTWREYLRPLEWGEPGIAESVFEIPREARLGGYSVTLRDRQGREWGSGFFRVEEFRVPLLRASIHTGEEPLVNPDGIPIHLAVEYLAGGPAKLLPAVLRHRLETDGGASFPDFEGVVFANGSVEEGIVRSGEREVPDRPLERVEVTLDDFGGALVSLPKMRNLDRFARIAAELEFRDPVGEVQTVASRIPVWPATHLVGIRSEGWIQKREALAFQVMSVSPKGETWPNHWVSADLYERRTYSHRKRLVGGFYSYEHMTETRRLETVCEGYTDEDGVLDCLVESPVSGQVILVASVRDPYGSVCHANRSLWVAGDEGWWFEAEDHDRIDLIPEKERYDPGETARFQVRMPFRRATALVTVEREGIVESFVTELRGEESVLEVPIRREFSPNVFVSALLVRGRVAGSPPTALVDLAKPAYKLGIGEIKVGWESHELKVRVEADRTVYRVRERARVTVEVSTAAGGPPGRGAELAVVAVDEGLLELSPNPSWDLLSRMMGRRAHAVRTSTAQMHVVGKRHYGLKALPHGGGGGTQATRELFDTLLLWKGRVPLDAEGRAAFEVPLNDSVTAFRIVAVATAGLDNFGTGSTSIRTSQDLILFSGIPAVAREEDRFRAEFTLRNTSEETRDVEILIRVAELEEPESKSPIRLAPGEASIVGRSVVVPPNIDRLTFEVEVREGVEIRDRLRTEMPIAPRVPIRVVQALLESAAQADPTPIRRPDRALPGRGGIRAELRPSLLTGLGGVRDYMERYPYRCLEQVLSRAVTLDDEGMWRRWMEHLPPHLDGDGLLRYFPGSAPGSDTLTAYVLALAHQKGWAVPEESLRVMLDGLAGFVEGRIVRVSELRAADLTLRKLTAIESLSRYGVAVPAMLSALTVAPELWPTSAVLDWLYILQRLEDFPNRAEALEAADRILRSRLDYRGTVAGFSQEDRDRLWWLMVSPDANLARLLLAFLQDPSWLPDLPRLARGLLARQADGRWDLTTANAWGVLAMEAFAGAFEADSVTGSTAISLDGRVETVDWEVESDGGAASFEWPETTATLRVDHRGDGNPWLWLYSRAALEAEEIASGYRIRKTLTAVDRKREAAWSVGDVVRVRLEIEAQRDFTWVVVSDPIPGGATILGSGLGRDSDLLTGSREREALRPAFEERSYEHYRAYYHFAPRGTWVVEYTVRLNAAGDFGIPPTRVEALYFPEAFGELPNNPLRVDP